MPMKLKTITLSCIWPDQPDSDYRVESITDSIEFQPGSILKKSTVQDLCDAIRWKVTVKRAGR